MEKYWHSFVPWSEYIPTYICACVCVCVCVICYEWNSEENYESLGTNLYSLPKLRRLAVSSEKADSQVGISLRDFRFSQRYCWRLKSSGMLRAVDWSVVTGVSKAYCAATFRVKQSYKTWMWYFGVYGVVGIVTRLQTGHPRNCGLIPVRGKGFFSSVDCSDRLWSPPSFLFDGYRVSFPGIKWRGMAVTTHLPSSAEVKERVELCLCSPFGLSRSVLEWTLPFFV